MELVLTKGERKEVGPKQMIIKCTNCGEFIAVNGLGRKPLNIPLKNVCEALQVHRNVSMAAKELNCSEGYIFNVLKTNGFKLKDIIAKVRDHN